MKSPLDAILKRINEKYGAGTCVIASEAKALAIPRLSTGVFGLDIAVGGGIPLGRISMFYGPKSSGKSLICLKLVANAQRMCRKCHAVGKVTDEVTNEWLPELLCPKCGKSEGMRCCYIDIEGCYSNDWGQRIGLKLDALVVTRVEYGEQAADIVDAMLRSTEVDLVIVDSLAMMLPKKIAESSAEDATMGIPARMTNDALKRWVNSINSTGADDEFRPTVILVNQVRQSIGAYSSEVRPGGRAQEFVTSLEVRLHSKSFEFESGKETSAGIEDKPMYVEIDFKVKKNKCALPGVEGVFKLWLREHEGHPVGYADDEKTIVALCRRYGLIKEVERKWTVFEETFSTLGGLVAEWMKPGKVERLKASISEIML